jgi:hypothetical protein
MSFLDVCAAAGDRVADQVADAIRDALAGRLPGSLTVEVPCHSPRTERWFDLLISARRDDAGQCVGATVTLEESATQACPGLAGQLRRALGELDAVIRDAHTAVTPRDPGPRG